MICFSNTCNASLFFPYPKMQLKVDLEPIFDFLDFWAFQGCLVYPAVFKPVWVEHDPI